MLLGSELGLVRLRQDGTVDPGFQARFYGDDRAVFCLAVQPDDKVIIGGDFNMGANVRNIARINPDGTFEENFSTNVNNPRLTVYATVLQQDAKVIVGGASFDLGRNNLMRLLSDGSPDTNFLRGLSGPNSWVTSVAIQDDGRILIGGDFDMVNGWPVKGIARLWGSPDILPRIEQINASPGAVTIVWEPIRGRVHRVQYTESLSLTTWTDLHGDVSVTNGLAHQVDPSPGQQRFYRVQLLP